MQIDVEGTYRHAPSGFVFPEQLGPFRRVIVNRYDTTGDDVGVGYNLELPSTLVAFTLYVRPAGRAADGSTVPFDQHFSAEVWTINHYHPGARALRRQAFTTLQAGKAVTGEMAEFVYADTLAGYPEDVVSRLYLFESDGWIVKYRVTFAVAQEEAASAAVDELVGSLNWRDGA